MNLKRPRWHAIVTAIFIFLAKFLLFDAPARAEKDPPGSAKAVAQLLEDHYRHAQTLRAVFLERYSAGPREARTESGTVYFRRPGRMRWEYEAPLIAWPIFHPLGDFGRC